MLGHNYTCWLGFKGGKGIATTGGVIWPWCRGQFFSGSRFYRGIADHPVYLGRLILAALVLTTVVCVTQTDLTLKIVTIALCVLAILKHRTNIKRLIAGTENRISLANAIHRNPAAKHPLFNPSTRPLLPSTIPDAIPWP